MKSNSRSKKTTKPTAKKAARRPASKASSAKAARAKKRVAKPAPAKPYFVHERGLAESEEIGQGTRVWANAHVMRGAKVGAWCNIGECSFVENGAVLGDHVTIKNGVQVWSGVTCEDYVFVGPNATFTNDLRPRVARPVDPADFAKTHVSCGASIGANATIVAGTRIGRHAMIGAGAVIIRDVPDHALMVGNPARRIGWACECGEKLSSELACACGKSYEVSPRGLISSGAGAAQENGLARGA